MLQVPTEVDNRVQKLLLNYLMDLFHSGDFILVYYQIGKLEYIRALNIWIRLVGDLFPRLRICKFNLYAEYKSTFCSMPHNFAGRQLKFNVNWFIVYLNLIFSGFSSNSKFPPWNFRSEYYTGSASNDITTKSCLRMVPPSRFIKIVFGN